MWRSRCWSWAIQKDDGSKVMAAEQALAWWISERTTGSRCWPSERLIMGDEPRVTQAIHRVTAGGDRELRARLEKAGEDQN